MRVKLIWSNPEPDQESDQTTYPRSLVVKVMENDLLETLFDPSARAGIEKMKKDIRISHNVECAVYALDELHRHVPMARCCAMIKDDVETVGLLILEDLSGWATLMPPRTIFGEGVNLDQLHSLLDVVTSLHAWSLNTNVDWKSQIQTMAETPGIAAILDSAGLALPQSMSDYPEIFEGIDEQKLQSYLKSESCQSRFGSDPWTRYRMPLVLVHGDFQGMNLLWEKTSSSGEAGARIAALLDWQMAHQGCGAEDLARIFALLVPTEIRRETMDEIIRRYVEVRNRFLVYYRRLTPNLLVAFQ